MLILAPQFRDSETHRDLAGSNILCPDDSNAQINQAVMYTRLVPRFITYDVSTTNYSNVCQAGSCRYQEAAVEVMAAVHTDKGYITDDNSSMEFMADENTTKGFWTEEGSFTIDTLLLPCWRPGYDALHLPLCGRPTKGLQNYPSVAADAVFNTYELLEAILEDMSMLDLLRFQRVSKVWKSVINDSRSLQQKLFMIAAPEPPDRNEQYRSYNPLLLSRCLISELDRRPGCASRDLLAPTPLDQLAFRIPSGPELQASWRKMFITQPPLAAVRLEVNAYGDFLRAGEFDPTKEFRLGDIVENPGYEMCGHITGNGRECRYGILRVIERPR
jgi:hypothetical protein